MWTCIWSAVLLSAWKLIDGGEGKGLRFNGRHWMMLSGWLSFTPRRSIRLDAWWPSLIEEVRICAKRK